MSLGGGAAFARLRENAFHVLGLPPTATRAEVERGGQKLLGMLELGLSEAKAYATPVGPVPRTPEAVRAAMAALRDPVTRLGHELWAQLPADAAPHAPPSAEAWPEATARLGWSSGR